MFIYHLFFFGSAGVVAGTIALMLEANPRLTYRDVQHILVRTASTERLGSFIFLSFFFFWSEVLKILKKQSEKAFKRMGNEWGRFESP